ncbi:TonB-dependent receptor [Paraflavitalea pollutisoli]|uniref:TonB-dependent receptor n=1 Tax=Paraflavitalea pollutisoli TaxID=3034143 RepID=UPI0023EB6CE3|nr:TonB-dependent receptor [Paraflavitalea sp. H1-2-19X]
MEKRTPCILVCCVLAWLAICMPLRSSSQSYRLTVRINDTLSHPIHQATIQINGKASVADSTGAFTDTLPGGRYRLLITAIGYEDTNLSLQLTSDYVLQLTLRTRRNTLDAVTVLGSRTLHRNQMSAHTLDMTLIQKLPVILGEVDPMKTITLLPGVKSGGDASAGIYVRGGGPDQNLVLLDGIPIYNPNHLLGFFSVFNGDALRNIEVIKGGIPAEYGGRLSSVIAVNTRDGNRDSIKGTGGIGLISSRLTLEGPLIKKKSTFTVSMRRTYIDQVARLVAKDTIGDNGYYFYDINAKVDYQLNDKNALYFTFYTGRDNFTFVDDDEEEGEGRSRSFNAAWGNTIAGLTWKQQLNKQLKQELTIVRNDFNLTSRITFNTNSLILSSGLTDYQAKNDWNYTATNWMRWKAGAQYIWHNFRPGAGSSNQGTQEFRSAIQDQFAHEAAAYLSTDIDITPALNLVAGMRYSYFNQVGPTDRMIYGPDGAPTGETETYKRGESIARYHYPEPRISLQYKLTPTSNIKLSYTRTIQYLHLATTSAATFPTDLWVPSSRRIQPEKATQVAAGYFKGFGNGQFEFSAEAYYKTMTNQLEFKPGAQLLLNQNMDGEMIFGSGKAYGLELFFQKRTGRLSGWIGYTLSRSERTFAELNDGKPYPYRYDRTHDLSVVANYQLNRKWSSSLVFVYGTGNALTMPTGRFVYSIGFNAVGNAPIFTSINQYDKINDYRMPAYHRLDLSFTYTPKPESTKRFKSSWAFGLYNVYSRQNPYFIYLDVDEEDRKIQGKKVFLFPIIPGVTWNFKF